jgi:hypothetical protein
MTWDWLFFLWGGWQGNGQVFCVSGDLCMFYNAQKATTGNVDFVFVKSSSLMFFFLCLFILETLSLSQLFWTSVSNMLMEDDATLLSK